MKRLLCSNFKSKRRFCSFFCDPCFFYRKSFLFSCVRTSIPSALGLDLFPFLFQIHSFFSNNKIVFQAESEYLKIFLPVLGGKYPCEYSQIIAHDIFVVKCIIWCLDGVKIILEPACRDQRLIDIMHKTSCRNVVSIEHSASAVVVAFWLVLLFRDMKILIRFRLGLET